MPHIVIIGAGPIGLYLAYKLKKDHKDGIDLVLYDPRLGVYVRPGHVNQKDLIKLETILGKTQFSKTFGHIKDIERTLYKEVTALGIEAQPKKFVRLLTAPLKGIIVQDIEGVEEQVECDYLFDCTGSQRAVIHQINQSISPPPFTIKSINEQVRVKQHLLAYVRMSKPDFNSIKYFQNIPRSKQMFHSMQHHVHAINPMRALGWHEFGLTNLYGVYFGKEKVCLYTECPDNLAPESYEEWLQTVITASTRANLSFSQLEPSKKYKQKPRLISYSINPKEVQEVAFSAAGLPTIIPLGDSQIEPHSILAHGINNGLDRVDAFMNHIHLVNGTITHFNQVQYQEAISQNLHQHRQAIMKLNQSNNQYFENALYRAQTAYIKALKTTSSTEEVFLENTLRVISARIMMHDAIGQLNFLNASSLLKEFDKKFFKKVLTQLQKVLMNFVQFEKELAAFCSVDRTTLQSTFSKLAETLEELGTSFLAAKEPSEALIAYKEAHQTYQHPLCSIDQKYYLTITSKLVSTCHLLEHYKDAVSYGTLVLSQAPDTEEFVTLRRKTLYPVLRSLQALILNLTQDNKEEIGFLKQKGSMLLDNHALLLDASTYREFCLFFGKKNRPINNAPNFFEPIGTIRPLAGSDPYVVAKHKKPNFCYT